MTIESLRFFNFFSMIPSFLFETLGLDLTWSTLDIFVSQRCSAEKHARMIYYVKTPRFAETFESFWQISCKIKIINTKAMTRANKSY